MLLTNRGSALRSRLLDERESTGELVVAPEKLLLLAEGEQAAVDDRGMPALLFEAMAMGEGEKTGEGLGEGPPPLMRGCRGGMAASSSDNAAAVE